MFVYITYSVMLVMVLPKCAVKVTVESCTAAVMSFSHGLLGSYYSQVTATLNVRIFFCSQSAFCHVRGG